MLRSLHGQLLFADAFNYPDGPIVGAAGSAWVTNYEPTNEARIAEGKLVLTADRQESIRIDFPSTVSGALYARMTVNFSALPSGAGNFFAFFRVTGADNLRARIWATTNGAAPGRFRLGITTIFVPPTIIPRDLHLGSNYVLVARYGITNCHSTLWIDPRDEGDMADRVDDIDDAGVSSMGHFGFLQTAYYQASLGNYIGGLTVDDLRVGRTFAEVLPLAKIVAITNAPNGAAAMRAIGQATTNYILQANTDLLTTNWVNLGTTPADDSGSFEVSDPDAGNFPRRFYRLQKQ